MAIEYISKVGSLNFIKDWQTDFEQPAYYTQLFSMDDTIRFQLIVKKGTRVSAELMHMETGEIVTVNGIDTGVSWDNLTILDFDLTGRAAEEGEYRVEIKHMIFTLDEKAYFRIVPPGSEEIRHTVCIRYTNHMNEFDAAFVTGEEHTENLYFDFRVEGGFMPGEITFPADTNDFRDQRYVQKQLSALPYRVKTFTAGTSMGVPNWVGEKLNLIFSCPDVTIDGIPHARSEGAQPEVNAIASHYPLFVYKLNLEEQENYKIKVDYDISNVFRVTLNITEPNTTLALPFREEVDLFIDWGDEVNEKTNENFPLHTFTQPGMYQVMAAGSAKMMSAFPRREWGEVYGLNDFRTTLVSVDNWGDLKLTDCSNGLTGCENLEQVSTEKSGFLADVISTNQMFSGCKKLQNAPEGIMLEAKNLKYASGMYSDCSQIKYISDNHFKNSPELEEVSSLFSNCTGLLVLPYDFFSNNKKISIAYALYSKCVSLTRIPVFEGCEKLTSLDRFASECESLSDLHPDLFKGCISLKRMDYIFWNCKKLTSLPKGLFDSLSSLEFAVSLFSNSGLTDYDPYLFKYCFNLMVVDGLFSGTKIKKAYSATFKDNPKLYSISWAFSYCSELTDIDPDIFSGLDNIVYAQGCFGHCEKLTNQSATITRALANVENFDKFYINTGITTVPSELFARVNQAKSITNMFEKCKNLISIEPGAFKYGSQINRIESCFKDCENLTHVPDNLFYDAAKIQYADYLFQNSNLKNGIKGDLFVACKELRTLKYAFSKTKLTGVPAGFLSTCIELTDISSLFYESNVAKVEAGFLANNSKVTTIESVFGKTKISSVPYDMLYGMPLLTNVAALFSESQLSDINEDFFSKNPEINNVTSTFYETHLTSIPNRLFDKQKKITSYSSCFRGCSLLKGTTPKGSDNIELWKRETSGTGYPGADGRSCFWGCTGLSDYNVIPDRWKEKPYF